MPKPFVFVNFVSTVDGKIQILKETQKYWPLGSKEDGKLLLELREKADTLIHGKTTALNSPTLKTLSTQKLKKDYLYVVLSSHPTPKLKKMLSNPPKNVKTLLSGLSPKKLLEDLYKKGKRKVLLEGGAMTLGQFLKEDLIDEIYLTITPKIVGNAKDSTLTLVEGVLFPPNKIKHLKLISVKRVDDELFLRYKVK